jgi:hypothetical protein
MNIKQLIMVSLKTTISNNYLVLLIKPATQREVKEVLDSHTV